MSNLNCPHCHSALSTTQYEGVGVDWCRSCQGVWLDTGELAKVVETREATISASIVEETRALARTGVPLEDSNRRLQCPQCRRVLSAINYDYSSGIIVDRCPDDHGTWLDGGELAKVQAYHEQWDEETKRPGASAGTRKNSGDRPALGAISRMMRVLRGH